MLHETFELREEGSRADARLEIYIQEYSQSVAIQERPMVLLCPGGGYGYTSDREAEPIALQFLSMGYHAAVLRYSCAPARYPTALLELARSVLLIREHAVQWHVDTDRLVIQGCSAGGHLAACYAMFWNRQWLREKAGVADRDPDHRLLRPNGLLLCYPVITSGEFAHRGSFENLTGDLPDRERLLQELSLEHQVNADVPPVFIWHTFEDQAVPVENALLMVSALRRAGISTEFHMYPQGGHGLALATALTQTSDGRCVQPQCAGWIELAHTWLEGIF